MPPDCYGYPYLWDDAQVVVVQPEWPEVPVLSAGAQAFQQGDYESAVAAFRQVVLDHPQDGLAHLCFGQALLAVGHYWDALLAIRRGLDHRPDWIQALPEVYGLYGRSADFDEQFQKLSQVANQYPSSAELQFLVGYMALLGGDPTTAVAHLQQAVALDPTDTHAADLWRAAKTLPVE